MPVHLRLGNRRRLSGLKWAHAELPESGLPLPPFWGAVRRRHAIRGGKENFRLPPGVEEGWAPDPNYKGKGLQLEFTVEDDGVFTIVWSATKTYRRAFR